MIGTVKEYEPGKKIKVVGPKDKDFSFDLDENVGMKGPVAVGDRVKVTYTKTDSGQKVTIVEPYKGHVGTRSKQIRRNAPGQAGGIFLRGTR